MSRKIIAILFSLVLVLTIFAGCTKDEAPDVANTEDKATEAQQETDTGTDEPEPTATPEPVTLTLLGQESQEAGIQNDPVSQKIRELTGISMDFIINSETKFQLMLSGGDLPDIFYSNMTTQGGVDYALLIQGGHVLALDDLIAEYGPNIAMQETKLEYSKRFKSAGQDKIYFLPRLYYKLEEGESPLVKKYGGFRFFCRWDVYKEIGSPQIDNEDELLDALKAMQDAYPETPDGLSVYAMSAWTDWGLWPFFVPPMFGKGYDYTSQNIYYQRDTGEYDYLYLTDAFWEGIKFFNKAYRMGLLDPEGFTMKRENYDEKVKAGQILCVPANSWSYSSNAYYASQPGMEEMAFVPVESGWEYEYSAFTAERIIGHGIDWSTAVSANTENPVAAIKLIDFFNSEEGCILNARGIKGEDWDIIDGKPQQTAEYLEKYTADPDYKTNRGIQIFFQYMGLERMNMSADGGYIDLSYDPALLIDSLTAAEKDFCEFYDVDYPGKLVEKWINEGRLKTAGPVIWPQLVMAESDDAKQITSNCEQFMRVAVVKAIMAESDEEYEQYKQEAIQGMKDRGIDTAMAEYRELFDAAFEAAGGFGK